MRKEAAKVGSNTAIFIERLLCDRPHPEQGYRSAQGVLSLARRYESERLELACERALVINALSYSSVANILRSGLDQAPATSEAVKPAPPHGNILGKEAEDQPGHEMVHVMAALFRAPILVILEQLNIEAG